MASNYSSPPENETRGLCDDGTTAAQFQSPKRRKTSHHSGLPTRQHDQYTIAWICALHIEMAAARAMLDDVHQSLPTHADDTNTYLLGSMKQHHVVITCLPAEQYGTNNAALVMMNLKRSFPAIRASLMVGIGGGVPGKSDIRLGDIVVGTRVMQYDLGKIAGDGVFQRTAIPRTPGLLLGTAVSALRSTHELRPSRVLSILQQKLEAHSEYDHPRSQDRLFLPTYDHRSPLAANCDDCDHSKLILRRKRISNDILIHYGAIASGNQVMRHGVTRDTLARELDVICFEMEAAGLMDIIPCLPVRGICDYSDSHKSKEWQRYAAATAAAYAKDLVEEIPVAETQPTIRRILNASQSSNSKRRQCLLESLRFEQLDYRESNIQTAHVKTCQWLLSHPDYEKWLDPGKSIQHHGFLWISGKAGTGKSTIMKFAYANMKRKDHNRGPLTAAFFFNARGGYLEKSILGMYRSLLLQLLKGYPDLQAVLDDLEDISHSDDCPSLSVLKDLFRKAIATLGQRSFTCFVDALDECDEQQVVDMVQYFEDLAEQSMVNSILFRICFSSRHYPYISIQRGLRLTLEDQPGHAEDLEIYVAGHLHFKDTELRAQLLVKASGVFMWVVLVVDILNKEYRRGGMTLRKKLTEMPSALSELFKDILRRDNENMEGLLLCILWILHAKRPLHPEEFYHALWSGLSLKDLVDGQIPNVAVPGSGHSDDIFARYVTSSSKGLAEVTKTKQPKVQFIHESVRDFLIKDKGMQELWPDLGFDCESLGHEKLKQSCNYYLNHVLKQASIRKLLSEPNPTRHMEALNNYSFLEYASSCILYHANTAAKAFPQDQFLSSLPVSDWIGLNNLFEKFKIRRHTSDANVLYILAERGLSELVRTRIKEDSNVHVFGERYQYPLFAALANGHKDTVAALLNSSSSGLDEIVSPQELSFKKDLKEYKGRTPLSWAAQSGRIGIVKLLLQTQTDIHQMDKGGRTALSRASGNREETIAMALIEKGADVNICDKDGQSPLHQACWNGQEAIARLLIEKGAAVDAGDKEGVTPLHQGAWNGHDNVARLLFDKGAEISTGDKDGQTPLHQASMRGHKTMTSLLLDKGALIDTCDKDGKTPLHHACCYGYEPIARLLIDKGADTNASDEHGHTPLHQASMKGHESVACLLLEKGADINIRDNDGRTPLYQASMKGHKSVVRLFIDNGADIKIGNRDGWTPLHQASRNGHKTIVKLLIDKDIQLGPNKDK
ncbi:unnamed protein product [Penicillium olsonii]|uniref:Nucleoside phosphorylase domain-containing protein n=1 Tax=Penicillium olsonii TaxID=99116 RepID=A0A9W4MRN4_PENOL|nr:unnamed protein product [Penicillium olsonii]